MYTLTLFVAGVEPVYKEKDMNIEEYNIKQGVGSATVSARSIADIKR